MLGRRTAALAAMTAGTFAFGAGSAQAAPVTVTDCTDLQGALGGLSDPVYLSGVVCADNYTIQRDMTLIGVNGGGFSAPESGRSLTIDNAYDVTLQDLRFTGGDNAGGVNYVRSQLDTRRRDGGADEIGDLVVSNTTFSGIQNDSLSSYGNGNGGALYANAEGSVTVTGSTFTGNGAGDGGGGAALSGRTVTVAGTTFADNSSGGSGGGLRATGYAQFATRADQPGEGMTISDSTFARNRAGLDTDDSVVAGGGLAAQGSGNGAGGEQGRSELPGDPVEIATYRNTFEGNAVLGGESAQERFGGGADFYRAEVRSDSDRFIGNSVGEADRNWGGGVSSSYFGVIDGTSSFSAVNGQFSGNSVAAARTSSAGGGIGVGGPLFGREEPEDRPDSVATVVLYHSTVTGNTAGDYGAGVADAGGKYLSSGDVDASIVWGNTLLPRAGRAAGSTAQEIDGFDTRTVTRSDWCATDPQPVPRATPDADGNICEDPKLVNLTTDVHETAASPTIDAVVARPGDKLAVDYDRPPNGRPIGAARDMGADEFPPPVVPPATPPAPVVPPAAAQLPAVDASPGCGSKRFFRIVLRKKRGPYKSAKIWVNGKKVKVTKYKKRPSTRIDLRRFGYQTIRIRITATLKNGKVIKGTRTYHPCRPSLDDGVPPKL